MSTETEGKAVLERFIEVATLAGIKGVYDEDGEWAANFSLKDDRTQVVYVQPIKTPEGPGVCVFSPAADYKKGFFGGISGKAAIELLRRNENLVLTRYGLRRYKNAEVVVASTDLLLSSLDPEELRCAMWLTAVAADAWELETTGGDEY